MKNIHILPTDDKRTNFLQCIKSYNYGEDDRDEKGEYSLGFGKYSDNNFYQKQNIYITSDDNIKKGDYFINTNSIGQLDGIYGYIHKCLGNKDGIINSFEKKVNDTFTINSLFCKKIILTTDQDLIKDGVQAIDDEFLEWFVKNPNCEFVEVARILEEYGKPTWSGDRPKRIKFKAIIPKEEQIKCYCGHTTTCDCGPKEEPKQETLEEAAENFINETRLRNYKSIFIEGDNWQEKRMYSEEEVVQLLIKFNQEIQEVEDVKGWFEQFKKK